jgi:hypothetical protein
MQQPLSIRLAKASRPDSIGPFASPGAAILFTSPIPRKCTWRAPQQLISPDVCTMDNGLTSDFMARAALRIVGSIVSDAMRRVPAVSPLFAIIALIWRSGLRIQLINLSVTAFTPAK